MKTRRAEGACGAGAGILMYCDEKKETVVSLCEKKETVVSKIRNYPVIQRLEFPLLRKTY